MPEDLKDSIERLIDFLHNRLDEQRALALAAPDGSWSVSYGGHNEDYPQRITNDASVLVAETYWGGERPAPEAEYIAYWNPYRVMRDIAGHRRTLSRASRWLKLAGDSWSDTDRVRMEMIHEGLRDLAVTHADHDEFDPQWRVRA
jgi:hypothetical protein